MAKKLPILRVAGPTFLVSLLLLVACTVSAIFLYQLHADTAASLTDDIDSRSASVEIETTVKNLLALLRKATAPTEAGLNLQVEPLNEQILTLLESARDLANTPEEVRLEAQLEASFGRYREVWDRRFDAAAASGDDPIKQAIRTLDKEVLPSVVRLRNYNTDQIQKSENELRRSVKWFAWGLVAVGCIGSLAGVVFGFGVARTLRRSIAQLSIRLRDAADKLGHDLPTVTLTPGEEGIDLLNAQMQSLMREIEQTVERLHQRDREVLRAEQLAAVGQMAAGVAHELRNPLTAVKLLVETSREDLESRGLPSEDLDIIAQETGRLERSLQAFLDFARPPRTERRVIDLAGVLEQALALLAGRIRKQNVRVDFALPDLPLLLEADGTQLRQLVVNLAMNALDVMPKGGTLTVKLLRMQLDRPFIEVHVLDTGPGIPRDLLPRLFTPFVSGKETGLGLGLVVSRRIAEDHAGSLWAMNQPAGGACMILRLPALSKT